MRDFLLPAWLVVGGSGTKFSLLGENRLKRAVSGVLGEFCTGWARQANVPGEFCTGWAAELDTPGEFCTGTGPACGTKFSLLGLVVGECAKKFAQRTKNGPKSAVCGVLGEFFRENTVVGAALGEFCRG